MISRWVVMWLQRTLGQTSRGPLQTLGVIHTPAMKGLKTETFYKAWFCMILLHIRRLGGGSQIFSYVFANLKSDIFLKFFCLVVDFRVVTGIFRRKGDFRVVTRIFRRKGDFRVENGFFRRIVDFRVVFLVTIRFKIWKIKYCWI